MVWLLLESCSFIQTIPMHSPLYPSDNTDVDYELAFSSRKGIRAIALYVRESTSFNTNSGFTFSPYSATPVRSWVFANPYPLDGIVQHTVANGYGRSKAIQYRFVLEDKSGFTDFHEVTFSIRPYPDNSKPIPIYCQGDPNYVFDQMYIPDEDILELIPQGMTVEQKIDQFYEGVSDVIRKTIHEEPTLKNLNRNFNIYTLGYFGDAELNQSVHCICGTFNGNQFNCGGCNTADIIGSMESIGILHDENFDDFVSGGSPKVFSSEVHNPQTVLHEMGHSLFDLYDEYRNNSSALYFETSPFPNNWDSFIKADNAKEAYGKTSSDIRNIIANWHKLCEKDCPMNSGAALYFDFDSPCAYRAIYEIIQNALNSNPN